MRAELKKLNGCARTLTIEVEPEETDRVFDQVYADLKKSAQIPGFRKGTAPRDLLETRFAQTAQEEMVKRAIPQYYLLACEQEGLEPVAPPEVENVEYRDKKLYFSARFDVRPVPKLKNYKGIVIKKKRSEITQTQIDQIIQNLRQSKAKEIDSADGAKKEKTLPELNDAFAQEMGLKTMDELKETIRKNLEASAKMQAKTETEQQLLEGLLKRATLDAPESLVHKHTHELVDKIKRNHILQGKPKEEIESKESEFKAEAHKEAERRIKLSFIIEEVAQHEGIEVNEEDIAQRIKQISEQTGQSIEQITKYVQDNNLTASLKDELRSNKTIEFLLKEAKIDEPPRLKKARD